MVKKITFEDDKEPGSKITFEVDNDQYDLSLDVVLRRVRKMTLEFGEVNKDKTSEMSNSDR